MNSLTKEQKREFAFKRQLEKARGERDSLFKKQADEIAELKRQLAELTKPKEAEKDRNAFSSDDEYMKYLTKREVNGMFAERDAEKTKAEAEAKAKAEADEKANAETQAKMRDFEQKSAEYFKGDAEGLQKFYDAVRRASAGGLGTIIDQDPVSANFYFSGPDGIAVLNKVCTDIDTFNRVYKTQDPLERSWQMHKIADEIRAEKAKPKELPVVGKPGIGAGTVGSSDDLFADSKKLSAYIKARMSGRR